MLQSTSDSEVIREVIALYDYEGQYEDELSFSAGDRIQVTTESESIVALYNRVFKLTYVTNTKNNGVLIVSALVKLYNQVTCSNHVGAIKLTTINLEILKLTTINLEIPGRLATARSKKCEVSDCTMYTMWGYIKGKHNSYNSSYLISGPTTHCKKFY